MFYIYVLESLKNKKLYFGYTKDLKKRIEEHNSGENFSTKPYAPWKLIYYEACLEKDDATRRENYLKTTQGKKMLKLRLSKYFNLK
ncbi:MAG TPA: GIY-YIG nuclease family protein [Candidatus Moranbacteria bacterium]|nr:GIY-YIG nuclease family protein [Candidatus Moranbacteria bacterium]